MCCSSFGSQNLIDLILASISMFEIFLLHLFQLKSVIDLQNMKSGTKNSQHHKLPPPPEINLNNYHKNDNGYNSYLLKHIK